MIKDIVVHLTGSEEDEVRLQAAETVAGLFDAHLTGLLVHVEPELITAPDTVYADILQSMMEEARTTTDQRRKALSRRFSHLAGPHDLRTVSAVASAVGDALARESLASDMFIGTRPYGDPEKNHKVEETVLFGSAGPCLFLPPNKPTLRSIDNILIAWKTRREAARAVKNALPFLKIAKQVTLGIVTDEVEEESHTLSGADIARLLSRHGIKPEIKELSGWHSASEALLHEVASSGAHMVVAGAFGRPRWQQRLIGGVTRDLLTRCEVPVLMSR